MAGEGGENSTVATAIQRLCEQTKYASVPCLPQNFRCKLSLLNSHVVVQLDPVKKFFPLIRQTPAKKLWIWLEPWGTYARVTILQLECESRRQRLLLSIKHIRITTEPCTHEHIAHIFPSSPTNSDKAIEELYTQKSENLQKLYDQYGLDVKAYRAALIEEEAAWYKWSCMAISIGIYFIVHEKYKSRTRTFVFGRAMLGGKRSDHSKACRLSFVFICSRIEHAAACQILRST